MKNTKNYYCKIKKWLKGAFISVFGFNSFGAFATGYPVFDVSNWITAIDEVYQGYDMISNMVTQLENQYTMIQQQIERAKTIDWDNIKFDGDFDIRDEIKDATKKVNRLLSSMKTIQNLANEKSITCGNAKYSLADLCGVGRSDNNTNDLWEDDTNFLTAVKDIGSFLHGNMQKSVDALTNELTDEEKRAIWTKYGISPSNYTFVKQSTDKLKLMCSSKIAAMTEKAKEAQVTETQSENNVIIQAAKKNLDSNGNPTANGMLEAQMTLTANVVTKLTELNISVQEVCALAAQKMIADMNKEEANSAEERKQEQTYVYAKKKINSRYKR